MPALRHRAGTQRGRPTRGFNASSALISAFDV